MASTSRQVLGSSSGGIRIEGLAPLSKALRELDPELKKELRDTNKKVATTEAERARAHALSIGGVAAKSAPAVKPSVGMSSAGIAITASGGYEFGAAFGGRGRPTTMQFQPWIKGGYFPYPTIADDSTEIADTYIDAVNDLIQRAFPIET